MQRPIFFSLAIIIAAYLPLFTLERVERRLFTPMAYTVCFALLGALALALTLVPVLATWVFRHGARTWRNPLLEWMFDRYEVTVRWTLAHARVVVGAGSALVVGGLALAGAVGTEFLPQLDEGVIWIRSNLPPGISLEESAETATRIRELVRQSPEVRMVMSQTGRNDSGMDPFGPNRNEFLIEPHPLLDVDVWQDQTGPRERAGAAAQQPHSGCDLQYHAADHRYVYRDCDGLVRRSRGHHQRS